MIRPRRLVAALLLTACATVPARAQVDHENHLFPVVSAPPAAPDRAAAAAVDSVIYGIRVLTGNQLGLLISNYGFIGTNFSSRSPSFEYPLGSGFQHLVRGGPWIGSAALDDSGAFVGVDCAAIDGVAGSAAPGSSEFTPADAGVSARSTLPNSRFFNPYAVSEQDFITGFSDLPAKRSIDATEKGRPLQVLIHQYNYEWSFSNYAHMVFFHYVVINNGRYPLRNLWFGTYAELASGDMNRQANLPPAGWFNKKSIAWIDSLRLFEESYCELRPIPDNCAYSKVPYTVGIQLLGTRPGNLADTSDKKVTLASWNWRPGSNARDRDVQRYAIMSTGEKVGLNPVPDSLAPFSGDPVELIAAGPWTTLNPGDSVQIDFAYLGAANDSILQHRARIAQNAYDLNYLVPVPPPSPRFRVVPREHAIDYYWDRSPEDFIDPTAPIGKDFEGYRVYIGESRDSLRLVGQFDLGAAPHDTTGFNTGFGRITPGPPTYFDDQPGVPYAYKFTVDHLRDGFKYWSAVTAYDLGNQDIEPLESGPSQNEQMVFPAPAPGEHADGVTVFPNPYRVEAAWDRGREARDHYLWFANLPKKCRLRIYTLSGSLIFDTTFDGSTYTGSNARGIYRPANDLKSNLSGTMFGWNLITRYDQAAATGLYIWAIENQDTGKHETGKFLLVKSDRESF